MTTMTYPLGERSVKRIGFGAMQLPGPGVWGPPRDREAALAVLRRAVELGVDHIDTAQYYGPDVANELIHDALHPYPGGLRIATKGGASRGADRSWRAAAAPTQLREQVEANLRSLRLERLALVNLRLPMEGDTVDDPVPFEESLGALVDLRDKGKIELIGLSAVTVETLEAGLALTEIACVQNGFNLLERLERGARRLPATRARLHAVLSARVGLRRHALAARGPDRPERGRTSWSEGGAGGARLAAPPRRERVADPGHLVDRPPRGQSGRRPARAHRRRLGDARRDHARCLRASSMISSRVAASPA